MQIRSRRVRWWEWFTDRDVRIAYRNRRRARRGVSDGVTVGTTPGGMEVRMASNMAMFWAEVPPEVKARLMEEMDRVKAEEDGSGVP